MYILFGLDGFKGHLTCNREREEWFSSRSCRNIKGENLLMIQV